jgi:hypothetical protein
MTEAEEKVKQIQANILAAQSHQKSYTDMRHSPLEFEVADHVYLRVSPMEGVCRFGIKRKLAPRYIDLYDIIDKYGLTSYQVELPLRLSRVHNVFHPIGTGFDIQDIPHQDYQPIRPGHTQQDYTVLQGPME